MAAVRSPRSPAFQLRQARKAKALADKAQDRFTPRLASDLQGYFLRLKQRLSEELRRSAIKATVGPYDNLLTTDLTKIMNTSLFTGQQFWKTEKQDLQKVLSTSMMKIGVQGVQNSAVLTGTATTFTLANKTAEEMTWRIGKEVTGITDETRQRLAATIKQGIQDGVHPSVIAKTMLAQCDTWAGLENLTASRAYTIARTETAHAYNWGALLEYKRSGIVQKVVCHDAPDCGWIGHNGSELANGTHRTLQEAGAHPLSHPNCVRAFSPAFGDEPPGIRERPKNVPPAGPATTASTGPVINPPKDLWKDPKKFSTGTGTNSSGYGYGQSPLEAWGHDMFLNAKATTSSSALSSGEQTLKHYQGSGYQQINGALRGGYSNAAIDDQVEALEDYIDRFDVPEAVEVWRGVGSGRKILGDSYFNFASDLDLEAAAQRAIGRTFDEDGFMSTALDRHASFGGVKLQLTVPPGYHAVPVSTEAVGLAGPYSGNGATMAEAELLLQHGARYVIDGYRLEKNAYARATVVLYGRILP